MPRRAPPRPAAPEDAAILARLNAPVQGWHAAHRPQAFLPNPDPAALADCFSERLSDPACTAFPAGEPPLGCALCALQVREVSVFPPPVRRRLIEHVAVAPEARRQGHGRALLQAARALERDLAVDEILLDTWAANTEAQAFFRAMGFSPRRMLFQATP